MKSLTGLTGLLALLLAFTLSDEARAQNAPAVRSQVQAPRSQRSRSVPVAPYSLGIGRRPISKPFSNIYRRPTVSPYLNLERNEALGLPNYQTLVRPQIEAQEEFRRQQRSINRLNNEVRNFQLEGLSRQYENDGIRSTGHRVRFMNLSHYYPNSSR